MFSTNFLQVVDVVKQNIIFQHPIALRYKEHKAEQIHTTKKAAHPMGHRNNSNTSEYKGHKATLDAHNQESGTTNGTQTTAIQKTGRKTSTSKLLITTTTCLKSTI
jgi:hypothetical protein